MKRLSRVTAIIVLVLSFMLLSNRATAQTEPKIEQKGNVFVQKSTHGTGQITKTNYIFEDAKGNRDTIYLSPTGKAFIWKISKSGNKYKKYIPEVGRKINPDAYADEKTKSYQKQ